MQLRQTEETIRKLGLQADVVEARTSGEYERAFARLSAESAKGVVLLADPSVIEQRLRVSRRFMFLSLDNFTCGRSGCRWAPKMQYELLQTSD